MIWTPYSRKKKGWGTIDYRLLNMEYDGRTLKHIDDLCKKLYKGSTLPEPYAYYLMEKLKEQMVQMGVKYTFIRIHANERETSFSLLLMQALPTLTRLQPYQLSPK